MVLALPWVFLACIDPISLDIGEPERRLVVDGLLREGAGPHEVRLALPGAFTQGIEALREPVRGATVTIFDGSGNAYALPEQSGGRYVSPAGSLVGQVGETYQLRITLQDGRVFESDPSVMRPSSEVAEITTQLEEIPRVAGGILTSGFEITMRVSDREPTDRAAYNRWFWSGIWETQICGGSPLPTCTPCFIPVSGRTVVNIADTPVAPGSPIVDQLAASFPLPSTIDMFAYNFLVTIEQQSLTPEAYSYWSRIRDTRDQVGSMFDPPPDPIIGNVRNTADPTDYALGHFSVVGTSSGSKCTSYGRYHNRPPFTIRDFFAGNSSTCALVYRGVSSPPSGFRETCQGQS